jgi:hypothetical protein
LGDAEGRHQAATKGQNQKCNGLGSHGNLSFSATESFSGV